MTSDVTHDAVVELVERAEKLGPVPMYGDADWRALEPTDLRRIASTWRAAEAWRRHRSPECVLADVTEMVEADRQVMASRLVEASHDVAGALDWAKQSRRTTHAELVARRRWSA